MRERKTEPLFVSTTKLSLVGIAVATTLGLAITPSWAASAPFLRGILFDSSPTETTILLNANQSVPVKMLTKTRDTIEMELTVYNAQEAINTDFAQAKNIEQVILKPLGDNTLRVVIRGKNLGEPLLRLPGFASDTQAEPKQAASTKSSRAATSPRFDTKPDLNKPLKIAESKAKEAEKIQANQESLVLPGANTAKQTTKKAATEPEQKTVTKAAQEKANSTQAAEETVTNTSDEEAEAVAMLALEEEADNAENGEDADDSEVDSEENTPLNIPGFDNVIPNSPTEASDNLSERQAFQPASSHTLNLDENSEQQNVLDWVVQQFSQLSKLSWASVFRILFLVGIGGVLLKLMTRRPQRNNQFSNALEEQPQLPGNPLTQWLNWLLGRPAQQRPKRTQNSASAKNRPVGLRGLQGNPGAYYPQGQSQVAQARQGLSAYSQQANHNPLPERQYNSSDIDRELKRSLHMRQAIDQSNQRSKHNQSSSGRSIFADALEPAEAPRKTAPKPQAKPQVKAQAPQPKSKPAQPMKTGIVQGTRSQAQQAELQNNKQVLDFLKSVADLMEKDGYETSANAIKSQIE